jgi:DNA-binding MarR family transcriptional regulator
MSAESLTNSLPYLLAQAHRTLHGELDAALKQEDLPVEHWRVLRALDSGNGRTMSDLSRIVLMNMSALSKAIDRMTARALVHRKQDIRDQRRVLVYISDFGLDLLARCESHLSPVQDSLAGRLDRKDTERLNGLLRKLNGQ